MKPRLILLFSLCLPSCLYLHAADIGGDTQKPVAYEIRDAGLTPEDERGIKAMVQYAKFIQAPRKDMQTPEDLLPLLRAIELDPASDSLTMFFCLDAQKMHLGKAAAEQLQAIALKHPDCPGLNITAADLLLHIKDMKRDNLGLLLERAFHGFFDEKKINLKADHARTEFLREYCAEQYLFHLVENDHLEKANAIRRRLRVESSRWNPLQLKLIVLIWHKTPITPAGFGPVGERERLLAEFDRILDEELAALPIRKNYDRLLNKANIAAIRFFNRLDATRTVVCDMLKDSPNEKELLRKMAWLSAECGNRQDEVLYLKRYLELNQWNDTLAVVSYAHALRATDKKQDADRILLNHAEKLPAAKKMAVLETLLQFQLNDGRWSDAKKLLSRLPMTPDHTRLMALVCYRLQDYFQALLNAKLLGKFLSGVKPEVMRELLPLFGMIADKAQDMAFLEDIFEPYLKSVPADDEMLNFFGYVLADNAVRLDKAEHCIRKALAIKPDCAAYLDSLAWVLYRKKQFQEAWKVMEQCLKVETAPDAAILNHAGDIRKALGDKSGAKKYWENVLKQRMSSEECDFNLIRKKLAE